jgi:hypothetical protein
MKYKCSRILLTALALTGKTSIGSADTVELFLDEKFKTLEETVPGKFNIDSRLRYEEFDAGSGLLTVPDFGPRDRAGTSLRIRYGYTTPDFNGFNAMVEGETLTRLGGEPDDIHPLDNIGDGTDLNQAWVRYENDNSGNIKIGRQIYFLDDHRFIGKAPWRQNIQTFDAATFDYTQVDKLSVKGFYLSEQHPAYGAHNELCAYGLNVSYDFFKELKLTGFYYDIEGDDTGNADESNRTVGLHAAGNFFIHEQDLVYVANIAEQEDTGPSTLNYNASYFSGNLSTVAFDVILGSGFEILEPNFRMPLSSLHRFNGFADALLPTRGFTNGLEDFYIYAGCKIPIGSGIDFKAIYHWFDSRSKGISGENGGEEIDFVASCKINRYLALLSKYGNYATNGGVGNAGAIDKMMFTFEIDFIY